MKYFPLLLFCLAVSSLFARRDTLPLPYNEIPIISIDSFDLGNAELAINPEPPQLLVPGECYTFTDSAYAIGMPRMRLLDSLHIFAINHDGSLTQQLIGSYEHALSFNEKSIQELVELHKKLNQDVAIEHDKNKSLLNKANANLLLATTANTQMESEISVLKKDVKSLRKTRKKERRKSWVSGFSFGALMVFIVSTIRNK